MKEYKIVVLGNGGVGKSALTLQFVQGVFLNNYDATIEDSYRKMSQIATENARLEILDTAGNEQFTGMRELYYRSAQGFILVFSLNLRSTFEDIKKTYLSIVAIRGSDVPVVLVGNKSDLIGERDVDEQEAFNFARKMNIAYYETSAKLNDNVEQVFNECAILILKGTGKNRKPARRRSYSDSETDKKCSLFLKSCCCFLC